MQGFCLPLAILLHEGRELYLTKLLLAHLYDATISIVKDI